MSEASIFKYENKFITEGYDFIIGVDEAGRGPLAGPVVACAAALRKSQFQNLNIQINPNDQNPNSKKYFNLIRDSKKLSEKQREELHDFIFEHFHVGIGICDHLTIDRINILEATYLAMKKAITDLERNIKIQETRDNNQINSNIQYPISNKVPNLKSQNIKNIILVDGNKIIPNLSLDQEAIIGGDNLVKSISAASIIAKVTRDRMMKKMHEKYPEYNFARHKGYGTKLHMEMIKTHGPCEIHRRSFRPVTK